MLTKHINFALCLGTFALTFIFGCGAVTYQNDAKELSGIAGPTINNGTPFTRDSALKFTIPTIPQAPAQPEVKSHHIKIWSHKGGSKLKHKDVLSTIRSVLHDLPNVQANDHTVSLILETLIVESNVGAASYAHAAKNWKNYGIAQFTQSAAKSTLAWCKKSHPRAYAVLMKYFDSDKSLVDNLMENVPFCIALVSQYYLQRTKTDLSKKHVGTIQQRARIWNTAYNTAAGSGTPQVYMQRVQSYWKRHKR